MLHNKLLLKASTAPSSTRSKILTQIFYKLQSIFIKMGQDRPMFIFTANTANSQDNAQAASPNRRRLRKTSTPKRTIFRRKELCHVDRLLDSDSGSEAESSSSSSSEESSSGSSDSEDEEDEEDEYDDEEEEEEEDTSSSSSSSSSSDSESDVPMQTINDAPRAEGSAP